VGKRSGSVAICNVRKRKKKPSKKFRDEFGHTPVSVEEKIPGDVSA
jgi:hypothetical protein